MLLPDSFLPKKSTISTNCLVVIDFKLPFSRSFWWNAASPWMTCITFATYSWLSCGLMVCRLVGVRVGVTEPPDVRIPVADPDRFEVDPEAGAPWSDGFDVLSALRVTRTDCDRSTGPLPFEKKTNCKLFFQYFNSIWCDWSSFFCHWFQITLLRLAATSIADWKAIFLLCLPFSLTILRLPPVLT